MVSTQERGRRARHRISSEDKGAAMNRRAYYRASYRGCRKGEMVAIAIIVLFLIAIALTSCGRCPVGTDTKADRRGGVEGER